MHVRLWPAASQGSGRESVQAGPLDWNVPDYSFLSRRQKTLSVAITARPRSSGLHLLVDSTGVKMLDEGEWKIKKHVPTTGGSYYSHAQKRQTLGRDAGRSPDEK
jgi:hypothetical protein